MLHRLRLDGTVVSTIELMSKDSLLMTDADRARIAQAVMAAGGVSGPGGAGSAGGGVTQGIVILHGTDTLDQTGEHLLRALAPAGPAVPIVLTGAMRPFEMKRSDALQNLTEAIFATGVLPAGVYCVAHGKALAFPGVIKDRDRMTFGKRG
jgi:L-asparaginase